MKAGGIDVKGDDSLMQLAIVTFTRVESVHLFLAEVAWPF